MNSNSYLSLSLPPRPARSGRRRLARVRRRPWRRAVHRRHVRPARGARGIGSRASSAAPPHASSTPRTRRCSGWRSRCRDPTRSGSATRSITTASSARCASPTCRRRSARSSSTTTPPIWSGILPAVPDGVGRVVVIFDGIFSMRGDHAPLDRHRRGRRAPRGAVPRRRRHGHGRLARRRRLRRDRARHRRALRQPRRHLHRHVRQGVRREWRIRRGQSRADRGGAAEGGHLHLHEPARRGRLRRRGQGGRASRTAPRDASGSPPWRHAPASSGMVSRRSASSRSPGRTRSCRCWCATPRRRGRSSGGLFDHGMLAVGLTFPVVPRGDETIRFQVNAAHTAQDIDDVLNVLGRSS